MPTTHAGSKLPNSRYHIWHGPVTSCLACEAWCEQCNQCKCEVGKRKLLCPGFDVKQYPVGFEHWKIDFEIERIEQSLVYMPSYLKDARAFAQQKLDRLYADKKALALGD